LASSEPCALPMIQVAGNPDRVEFVVDPDCPEVWRQSPHFEDILSVPIREHAYQAGCHQRRRWRRRGGSGTGDAGGGKANRSAFCRQRSHSSRVSVSCARNSSETARNVAICASRTGVRSGVTFGPSPSVNLVIVYPR